MMPNQQGKGAGCGCFLLAIAALAGVLWWNSYIYSIKITLERSSDAAFVSTEGEIYDLKRAYPVLDHKLQYLCTKDTFLKVGDHELYTIWINGEPIATDIKDGDMWLIMLSEGTHEIQVKKRE